MNNSLLASFETEVSQILEENQRTFLGPLFIKNFFSFLRVQMMHRKRGLQFRTRRRKNVREKLRSEISHLVVDAVVAVAAGAGASAVVS